MTVAYTSPADYPDIRIPSTAACTDRPGGRHRRGDREQRPQQPPALVTTNPTNLIFAGNLVQTYSTGPGAGFTLRMITTPDGDFWRTGGDVSGLAGPRATQPQRAVGHADGGLQGGHRRAAAAPRCHAAQGGVTSPAAGATVSGTITVTVTASDTAGSQGSRWWSTACPGARRTTSPYPFSLNTAKFGNGSHAIGASASGSLAEPRGPASPSR